MIKIYIDFDGVVLDTWDVIFKEYIKLFSTDVLEEDKIKNLMITIGWEKILSNSVQINDSIKKIKDIGKNYEVYILTKINSQEEQKAKEEYLLKHNINNLYFVPYEHSKTQYVDVENNILIDDDIKNLDEWSLHGGKSIFFNKDLSNYDSYGNKNVNYTIINDLLKIYGITRVL